MDVIETIRYLNSADGPNIPLRTLGVYCGVSQPTLSDYLNGKIKPREETRAMIEKGIGELAREIWGECKWLL